VRIFFIRSSGIKRTPFHFEVTTSDPQQASSGGSAGTNLRSSPGFVPFAFEEPDNFGTFVPSPFTGVIVSTVFRGLELGVVLFDERCRPALKS
jgi:hypothetical protein